MARAAPYVIDAGAAKWTPQQHHPGLTQTPPPALLYAATASGSIAPVPVAHTAPMLSSQSHAEMLAAAHRRLHTLDSGTDVAAWLLVLALVFAIAVGLWVAYVYYGRSKQTVKA